MLKTLYFPVCYEEAQDHYGYYLYIYIYINVCVYVYISIFTCMYVHTRCYYQRLIELCSYWIIFNT